LKILSGPFYLTLPGQPAAGHCRLCGGRACASRGEHVELKNAHAPGALLDSAVVEREWSGILSGVRARMLAVPSRAAQRLPQPDAHAVAEVDREIRDVLTEAAKPDEEKPAPRVFKIAQTAQPKRTTLGPPAKALRLEDRFIRRKNVEHYHLLLERVTEEGERQRILKLLAEEQQKQRDAGDPVWNPH
jgi:hypothetical protein